MRHGYAKGVPDFSHTTVLGETSCPQQFGADMVLPGKKTDGVDEERIGGQASSFSASKFDGVMPSSAGNQQSLPD